MDKLAVGIDVGGTNIVAALVAADGQIAEQWTRATGAARGPEAVMDDMAEMVDELRGRLKIAVDDIIGLGIGTPGPLSHRDGVIHRSANLPGWKDVHIRRGMLERTGLPTILDNDANIAAFGEYWAGAGKQARDVVAMTLGTGLGMGVITNGEILRGHFENAGEFGHTIVEMGGRECPCGQRGCLEQYCSPGNIAKYALERIQQGEASSLSDLVGKGEALTSRDIVDAAQAGDAFALEVWDEACRYLGVACVNIQHCFNPQILVLAGGMTKAGDYLLSRVTHHHKHHCWNLMDDAPEIRISALGNDAGVIGAAGLAWAARNSGVIA